MRSSTLARARQFDDDARGQKRAAEDILTPGQVSPTGFGEQAQASEVPVRVDGQEALEVFAGLTMTYDQSQALAAERTDVHPLQPSCLADLDRRDPLEVEERGHGTWDGRWSFVCQRDWDMLQSLGAQLPSGQRSRETFAVQAARKEYHWSKMNDEQKKLWGEAARTGWNAYIDNQAIEVLSLSESEKVRKDLARRKELDRILVPRFVCTDKNDGMRTESHPLPVKASSRLAAPGFKIVQILKGTLGMIHLRARVFPNIFCFALQPGIIFGL